MELNTGFSKMILDEIDSKFMNLKTKSDVIRALEYNSLLTRIPLSEPVVTIEQAHKDFQRERVLLNEVAFIPDDVDVNRCHAFAATLTILVERLMRNHDTFNNDIYECEEDITDAILQHACRTSAGADSFFKIQKLLAVENTFVTQKTLIHDPPIRVDVFITECHDPFDASSSINGSETSSTFTGSHCGASSIDANGGGGGGGGGGGYLSGLMSQMSLSGKHKANKNSKNSNLTINHTKLHNNNYHGSGQNNLPFSPNTANEHGFNPYEARFDAICSRIQVQNSFDIYDLSSVDQITGNPKDDPTPWLEVEATLIDEMNFKTNECDRSLQLLITCPDTGSVYQSTSRTTSHSTSNTPSKRSSGRLSDRLSGRLILSELASWVGTSGSHHGGTNTPPYTPQIIHSINTLSTSRDVPRPPSPSIVLCNSSSVDSYGSCATNGHTTGNNLNSLNGNNHHLNSLSGSFNDTPHNIPIGTAAVGSNTNSTAGHSPGRPVGHTAGVQNSSNMMIGCAATMSTDISDDLAQFHEK